MNQFEDLSPREQDRLERTFALLPRDVRTGLEIGFYDLRVSNRLRESMDLVSIDLPRPVGEHRGHKLTFADIQRLPFADRTFDIVICTEVLEHLPDQVLERGVRELQRVSGKYLLVSVPYRQRHWNEMFKCADCGFVCNSMGHVQTLDDHRLLSLFNATSADQVQFVGQLDGYAPDWLYTLANRLGNDWQDYSFGRCPNCGRNDQAPKPNFLGFLLRRVIWRFERAAGTRPAWVVALLKVAR